MKRLACLSLAVLLCVLSVAHAQTTAFTKVPFASQPECDALLPDALSVTVSSVSDNTVSVEISVLGGSDIYSDAYTYDTRLVAGAVPAFIRTISLQGSRSAPAYIFIEATTDSTSSLSRMDFFIDASDFRSSDPTNSDFLENDICMVSFIEVVSTPERSVKSEPGHVTRAIATCVFESTTATFQDAVDCIRSVDFSEDQRTRTLDSLDILADIYVYRDINIDGPGSDPVQVDLVEELADLRNDDFDTNYDFHVAVRELFVRGRDIHTTYSLPVCYQNFQFFQPFSLYSTLNDNGDQILVVSSRFDRSDSLYNFAPGAFDGYIVEEIDGENAMSHYIDWVNNNIVDKQEANRFNSGLGPATGTDAFCFRVGVIPENPSISWTLVNPITNDRVTLVAPWYANTVFTYTSATEFSTRCLTDDFELACTGSSKRSDIPHHASRAVQSGTTLDAIGSTSLIAFNRKTAVLTVPNFFPTQLSGLWLSQSFAVLYLESIHRFHFDELMVDVSNNGGGLISTGLFLAGLLDKNQDNILDVVSFDQIHSDFFDQAIDVFFNDMSDAQREVVNSAGFGVYFYRVEDGNDEFPDPPESWYEPGVSYTRGGQESEYSQKVELSYIFDDLLREYLNDITSSSFYDNYDDGNVLIITNGLCYSTCSFFVRSLQESDKVLIVGYGGIENEDLRSSDVPANVVSAATITAIGDLFVSQGFTQFTDLTPRPFPFIETCSGTTGHRFQLALFESYAPGEDTPQEFTNSRVDIRINIWPESPTEVWPLAATQFLDNAQSTDGNPLIPTIPSIPSIPDLLSSSASTVAASLFSLVAALLFFLF